MKRTVKAFVRLHLESGSMHIGAMGPDIYWSAYDFENERLHGEDRIVPCTITYDDGKPAKKAKRFVSGRQIMRHYGATGDGKPAKKKEGK